MKREAGERTLAGMIPKLKRLFIADLTPPPPPFSLGDWQEHPEPDPRLTRPARELLEPSPAETAGPALSASLQENEAWLKRRFALPVNRGLVLRPVRIGGTDVEGLVAYLDDQVDWQHLNRTLMIPLIASRIDPAIIADPRSLIERVLTETQAATHTHWSDLVNALTTGSALLLVDGVAEGIALEAKGWAKRSVEKPTAELAVRGPQEGFTEDIGTSLSQVRRRLRTPDLMVERGQVGRLSRTEVALLYVRTVANPKLVEEVRRRLRSIDIDYLADSGSLEQLIEDRPLSVYPSVVATERPDRVAAQLAEGYVSILVANSAYALILPATIPMFMHSPEDAYLRWPFATFIRLLRTVAFFMALLVPGLYVAVANFHQEMIPTALMLAISGTRETVPIPVVLEVIVMEVMFELIREAGVRIPTIIGPTIGIVGALILGQAAVQAGLISPILVIITSATALASFAIPNYSLQYAVRVLRFGYLAAGAFLGLFGITLLFLLITMQQSVKNAFGVPFLTPLAPVRNLGDTYKRLPTWAQQERPAGVRPQDRQRQSDQPRPWDPRGPQFAKEGGESDTPPEQT
ncbi:MAG: spore germination protein [Bacillota bacterium]